MGLTELPLRLGPERWPWAAALLAALALSGCAPKPPARWQEGGAPLVLPQARWERGSGRPIELSVDGQVTLDGELLLIVDRVGRVADEEAEPLAVLLPDGRLAGTDARSLGHLGWSNAAPPGSEQAWLRVAPDGRVTFYEPDGQRLPGGRWVGCEGPALRTCTLITHVLTLRQAERQPRSGVTVGIGIGIGF